MYRNDILSRPVSLWWGGWTTDTFTLQQQGWSISAEQDMEFMSMRLALRNERDGMTGITERIDWDYIRYAEDRVTALPTLRVHLISRDIQVIHAGNATLGNFQPIDAQPQFDIRQRTRLEDFVHFAPAHTRTQQLIVPEETVDDLMSRILEMQQGPRIERIRQEVREGERVSFTQRQNFHAQIVSIAA
jgi:hypothetical protein